MDFALRYDRTTDSYDLSVDAVRADLAQEDTLTTAMLMSLMTDATAQADEVEPGADRRGWWADAFALMRDRFGSRLWLLQREKHLPRTEQRAREYVREALQWLLDDQVASKLEVTVFAPQSGWIAALVDVTVDGRSRRYRFEFNQATQTWRLAGELH